MAYFDYFIDENGERIYRVGERDVIQSIDVSPAQRDSALPPVQHGKQRGKRHGRRRG